MSIEDWGHLSRKVLNNDLRVYEDHAVSFMRNDREVNIGWVTDLMGKRHPVSNWMRLQVGFPAQLAVCRRTPMSDSELCCKVELC
jgi:hypothetical protein